jgi:hypothetical protein
MIGKAYSPEFPDFANYLVYADISSSTYLLFIKLTSILVSGKN